MLKKIGELVRNYQKQNKWHFSGFNFPDNFINSEKNTSNNLKNSRSFNEIKKKFLYTNFPLNSPSLKMEFYSIILALNYSKNTINLSSNEDIKFLSELLMNIQFFSSFHFEFKENRNFILNFLELCHFLRIKNFNLDGILEKSIFLAINLHSEELMNKYILLLENSNLNLDLLVEKFKGENSIFKKVKFLKIFQSRKEKLSKKIYDICYLILKNKNDFNKIFNLNCLMDFLTIYYNKNLEIESFISNNDIAEKFFIICGQIQKKIIFSTEIIHEIMEEFGFIFKDKRIFRFFDKYLENILNGNKNSISRPSFNTIYDILLNLRNIFLKNEEEQAFIDFFTHLLNKYQLENYLNFRNCLIIVDILGTNYKNFEHRYFKKTFINANFIVFIETIPNAEQIKFFLKFSKFIFHFLKEKFDNFQVFQRISSTKLFLVNNFIFIDANSLNKEEYNIDLSFRRKFDKIFQLSNQQFNSKENFYQEYNERVEIIMKTLLENEHIKLENKINIIFNLVPITNYFLRQIEKSKSIFKDYFNKFENKFIGINIFSMFEFIIIINELKLNIVNDEFIKKSINFYLKSESNISNISQLFYYLANAKLLNDENLNILQDFFNKNLDLKCDHKSVFFLQKIIYYAGNNYFKFFKKIQEFFLKL